MAMYYTVLLPIGLILTGNIVIFTVVLQGLFSARRKSQKHRIHHTNRSAASLHFQAAIAVFIILGKQYTNYRSKL